MFRKKSGKPLVAMATRLMNMQCALPFAAHHAFYFKKYLQSSAAQAAGISLIQGNNFFVSINYAERIGGTTFKKGVNAEEHAVKLPLPDFLLKETVENFEPREFFHMGLFEKEIAPFLPEKAPPSLCLPRCAITGYFFRREELVDNLMMAAFEYGYQNPFWLPPDHPKLRSGYCRMKPGEMPIVISTTAHVLSCRNDLELSGIDQSKIFHSSALVDGSLNMCSSLPGLNAITGNCCCNPVFQNEDLGPWISYDQAMRLNIPLKSTVEVEEKVPGLHIELESFELYNAQQLESPGRLGLKERKVNDDLFQLP